MFYKISASVHHAYLSEADHKGGVSGLNFNSNICYFICQVRSVKFDTLNKIFLSFD